MKKIAFTFAGRKKVMARQVAFMRKAIALGHLDEWHVWNFARKDEDKAWLQSEFGTGTVLLTPSDSVDYVPLAAVRSEAASIRVTARNDAHLLVLMESGACLEIVLGAFSNSISLLRQFDDIQSYRLHAAPILSAGAGLRPGMDNLVELEVVDGVFRVLLNRDTLFELDHAAGAIREIQVHTGYGSEGQWRTGSDGAVKLMECGKSGYEGFKFSYLHYARNDYADCLFLKLDDDIVYCDVDAIGDFFLELARLKGNDILSANVINNGVCAYYQGQNRYFPGLALEFDYPPEGLCGRLWESSAMCAALHGYFLDHIDQVKEKAAADRRMTKLPLYDRFSINFVGFKHGLFAYMAAAYLVDRSVVDDEHLMTRVVPGLFGVDKYVFNPLLVAHLSFYKQEETLASDPLVERYLTLPL
jgi:hypothetical protein